jgi:hypothetical protein
MQWPAILKQKTNDYAFANTLKRRRNGLEGLGYNSGVEPMEVGESATTGTARRDDAMADIVTSKGYRFIAKPNPVFLLKSYKNEKAPQGYLDRLWNSLLQEVIEEPLYGHEASQTRHDGNVPEKRNSARLKSMVPSLDASIARSALKGLLPFAEDKEKQKRYRSFLEFKTGEIDYEKYMKCLPRNFNESALVEEWSEFVKVATVRQNAGYMNSKFAPSSTVETHNQYAGGLISVDELATSNSMVLEHSKAKKDTVEIKQPTRSVLKFQPESDLCEKLNIPCPEVSLDDIQGEGNSQSTGFSGSSKVGSSPPAVEASLLQVIYNDEERRKYYVYGNYILAEKGLETIRLKFIGEPQKEIHQSKTKHIVLMSNKNYGEESLHLAEEQPKTSGHRTTGSNLVRKRSYERTDEVPLSYDDLDREGDYYKKRKSYPNNKDYKMQKKVSKIEKKYQEWVQKNPNVAVGKIQTVEFTPNFKPEDSGWGVEEHKPARKDESSGRQYYQGRRSEPDHDDYPESRDLDRDRYRPNRPRPEYTEYTRAKYGKYYDRGYDEDREYRRY